MNYGHNTKHIEAWVSKSIMHLQNVHERDMSVPRGPKPHQDMYWMTSIMGSRCWKGLDDVRVDIWGQQLIQ